MVTSFCPAEGDILEHLQGQSNGFGAASIRPTMKREGDYQVLHPQALTPTKGFCSKRAGASSSIEQVLRHSAGHDKGEVQPRAQALHRTLEGLLSILSAYTAPMRRSTSTPRTYALVLSPSRSCETIPRPAKFELGRRFRKEVLPMNPTLLLAAIATIADFLLEI